MIIPDMKRAVTTIVSRRNNKGEEISSPAPMKEEVSLTEPGVTDERHVAASDMLSAIHEKSPEKMLQALANFIDMHQAKSEKPEPKE